MTHHHGDHVTAVEARGATKNNVVRWMLLGGMAAVIAGFAAVYLANMQPASESPAARPTEAAAR